MNALRRLEDATLRERERRLADTRGKDLPMPEVGRPRRSFRGVPAAQRLVETRRRLLVALFAQDDEGAKAAALSLTPSNQGKVKLAVERLGLRWPL